MAGNVAADMVVHVGAEIGDAQKGLAEVGDRVNSTGKKFAMASGVMAGGAAAIIGGLGLSVMAAANFEAGMSAIGAVIDSSALPQMGQLKQLAMDIGKDTAFSATEGAAAIEELVKAGVSVDDVLGGAAMQAANLAAAGGIGIPEAATAMSNAMNMFSMSGKQAGDIADYFAAAAAASSADVSDLAQALAQGGSAASMMGMDLDDTVTALALFSDYGIKGSDAGTSLKTMLQRLSNPTDEAAAKMSELGINAFDSSGKFVGLEAISGQLSTAFKGMTEEQQNAALAMIFGADASRVAGVLAKEGAKGYAEMNKQVKDQGAAGRMAAKRMDNLAGAVEQLKGSLETAMIVIGSGFIPIIRGVAEGITGLLNGFLNLSPNIQKFIGIAAAAVAGALGIGAAISATIAFFGPAIAGFAALLTPIGLLVAAALALYLAWHTNFLGIQDILTGFWNTVAPILSAFAEYLTSVAKGGTVAQSAMEGIPGPLRAVAEVVGVVVRAFKDFIDVISGGGGIGAAFDALGAALTSSAMTDSLSRIWASITGAIDDIDWVDVGTHIYNGILLAVGYVTDVTAPLVEKLGNLTVALGNWVWNQASSVQWGTLLAKAASAAGDITGEIVGKLGDLGAALATWVRIGSAMVPWEDIANGIVDITSTIISKIGDLGAAFLAWYNQAIDSVPWNSLGERAGTAIGNLSRTLAPKAWELITGLGTAITENWPMIGKVLIGLFLGMPLLIGYLYYTLAPKALEFLSGFVNGLNINWPLIGGWLASLPGKLLAALPGLIGTLAPKGKDLLTGLYNAAANVWTGTIAPWLKVIGPQAFVFVGSLAKTLASRGLELLTGFLTAASQYWTGTIIPFLKLIGPAAVGAVGSLASTLAGHGKELLKGLGDAASAYWRDTVKPFLSLIPAGIAGAVGHLYNVLYNEGLDLMYGLRDGIEAAASSAYNTAKGWVDKITGLFHNVPGFSPIDHVGYFGGSQLFIGMATGLDEEGRVAYQTASHWMDKIIDATTALPTWDRMVPAFPEALPNIAVAGTPRLGSAATEINGRNSGATIIYQTNQFDVHVDELEDVVEAARFVRDIDTNRTLYFTGAS